MNRRRIPSPQEKQQSKKYKNDEEETMSTGATQNVSSNILCENVEINEQKSITTRRMVAAKKTTLYADETCIQAEKLIASIKLNEPTNQSPSSSTSGKVLRSHSKNQNQSTTTKEPELKSSQYPFIEYKGDIKYLIDMIDIACACDELMTWVELHPSPIIPIAFDMEWSFSFTTGPEKTALIQICAEENLCYLFHVIELKKLPAALAALLRHKKVQLHGVNIKNDLRKLQRDFPEVNVEQMIAQCIDLGTWCNSVCNTGGRWSLERLVLYICKLRINKDKKVRMSKWHVIPLNESQKMYAAIDVYISQVIHKELGRRLLEKEKRSEEFAEN